MTGCITNRRKRQQKRKSTTTTRFDLTEHDLIVSQVISTVKKKERKRANPGQLDHTLALFLDARPVLAALPRLISGLAPKIFHYGHFSFHQQKQQKKRTVPPTRSTSIFRRAAAEVTSIKISSSLLCQHRVTLFSVSLLLISFSSSVSPSCDTIKFSALTLRHHIQAHERTTLPYHHNIHRET